MHKYELIKSKIAALSFNWLYDSWPRRVHQICICVEMCILRDIYEWRVIGMLYLSKQHSELK